MINSITRNLLALLFIITFLHHSYSQTDTSTYNLTIRKEMVSKTGKEVMGMTINGSIPGPTLRFKEGGYAIIYVKNEMDVETSVHWHGLILPNYNDGVPYLTTPPIEPGKTLKYEFPLQQAGTYWYHSHTMLQEQSGVYGSIVIEPKKETHTYDKELVLVLSDWTDQKPMNVLRNLKRGNEWYNIKKGTATPLNRVIAQGGFGAQLNFWKQRMESADIADIYYNAFLTNGEQTQEYADLKPGEKVRLRIINGASSSQFWMTFGGNGPTLIAADGLDVVHVKQSKTFIAIAETYDFIIEIPKTGKIELRSMAQDGSGHTTAYFGKGEIIKAEVLPRPDKIELMKSMAKMDMRMGAPATKLNPSDEDPQKMMKNWGMKMNKKDKDMSDSKMKDDKHQNMDMDMGEMDKDSKKKEMDMSSGGGMKMDLFSEYKYDYLKSPTKTDFDSTKEVKEVLLNLTGNMWRYIWSMNGVPLSKADKIKINQGQVVRITLNNLTMMHHPMHLHGHFFRVINENGDYSPLKHTVNVPPMQKTVIEFDASESGEWFFHCHVLYHMMSGMARIYSYDTIRDPRLAGYDLDNLKKEGERFYNWGMADVASHMTDVNFVTSNTRNQFMLRAEYGWNKNLESELTYERFLYDYFRVFVGTNIENEKANSLDEISTTAIGGIRFLTPYMFNLDVRMDSKLRPQIGLSRSVMIFPKLMLFGEYEFQTDFGWVNQLPTENGKKKTYQSETVWSAGLEYMLSRNFSIMASYDNRFGAGGGLTARF